MKKKILCLAFCIFMMTGLALSAFAAALPQAPDSVYVLDEAGVLKNSTEQYIIDQGNALFAMTGAQIVIVTVTDSGYSDMEVFAYDLFNEWGIGSSELNNGVLLAMEPSTLRIWCTVGAGLERQLSSGVINSILEEKVYPYYDIGECDAAVSYFYDDVYGRLEDLYGVDTKTWDQSTYKYAAGGAAGTTASEGGGALFSIFAFIIIFIVFYSVISSLKRRTFMGRFPFMFFGPRYFGGFHHHHHHHHTPPRNNNHHGGFGGGFGGGGGFSGGGFGGGGSRGGGGGRH